MGNALRDQLLKAGLVNDKQIKKAAKEQHKEALRQRGQGKSPTIEEDRQRSQRLKEEKIERDRQLNQQRQAEADRKALLAQIRQLVEQNRQPIDEGDTPFNFVDRGKVKRLYLSEQARKRIVNGQLAIVRLEKGYALVPSETAEKINARMPECLVVYNRPNQQGSEQAHPDDPYAKFQIPDDLIW